MPLEDTLSSLFKQQRFSAAHHDNDGLRDVPDEHVGLRLEVARALQRRRLALLQEERSHPFTTMDRFVRFTGLCPNSGASDMRQDAQSCTTEAAAKT